MVGARYRKRSDQLVLALALELDTPGFAYQKWGGAQRCKRGDYLVHNTGDVYTVDRKTFERTYQQVAPATYRKLGHVWARPASEAGSVTTQEGITHYEAGSYLVSNDPEGRDSWAVTREKFESSYELDPE
jgi:hypothetical protein